MYDSDDENDDESEEEANRVFYDHDWMFYEEGMYDYGGEKCDEVDYVHDEEESFEMKYFSDEYFEESDSEDMKKLVASCRERDAEMNAQRSSGSRSGGTFKLWELLPSGLKEMILDELDFETWINFMICIGDNKEIFKLPYFSFDINRVSFYSNVIQEESKEIEHIRIRVHDSLRALMVKIRECDGYCKFSWNCDNYDAGSVNIPNCSYLKIAEKIMKMFLKPYCGSFKILVDENKTDPSAQCVSKWPYFHTFLSKCLGMENDEKKFVDEKLIVDFILEKANNLVVENPKSKKAVPMWWRRMECDLILPNLDAKKVVDSIGEQLPEVLANREMREPVKADEEEWVYERYKVTQVSENSIKIDGPMSDEDYNKLLRNDEKNGGNVE